MSLPWDLANLLPNLETLSQVQPGDRLSVLKEGDNPGTHDAKRGLRDRFVIKSKFKHGVVSLIKKEKLLDDTAYLDPLETLFREAVTGVRAGRSSANTLLRPKHVQRGYEGLKRLREGYKGDKLSKADEIVRRVGAAVASLVCEPGTTRTWDLLVDHAFSLRAWLSNCAGNAGLSQEHQLGDPANLAGFASTVYGAGAQPQPATRMPMTGQQYQRSGTGVCVTFWRDAIAAPGVTVGGQPISTTSLLNSAVNVRNLYQQMNNDEGLLFAVSQLASQAGVVSLPSALMVFSQYRNERQAQMTPLVTHGGRELVPVQGSDGADISFPQGAGGPVRLTVDTTLAGTSACLELVNGQNGPTSALADFGVTRVTFRIAVDVFRRGNRIDFRFVRAEYELAAA
jgi:hypothetical protein